MKEQRISKKNNWTQTKGDAATKKIKIYISEIDKLQYI